MPHSIAGSWCWLSNGCLAASPHGKEDAFASSKYGSGSKKKHTNGKAEAADLPHEFLLFAHQSLILLSKAKNFFP